MVNGITLKNSLPENAPLDTCHTVLTNLPIKFRQFSGTFFGPSLKIVIFNLLKIFYPKPSLDKLNSVLIKMP